MVKDIAGQAHRVVFIDDNGRPCAEPGRVLVRGGDTITFQSLGVGPISLILPHEIFVPVRARKGAPPRDHIPADSTLTFRVAEGHRGVYTYVAFCPDLDDVALGRSQPKIIIYE